jgi:hypothetical protein
MFKRHEDGTPEPNRREIAAQHHRQAKRYKLLSLIEFTKGHLTTERPGPNSQGLLDTLAHLEAELDRHDNEDAPARDDTVVRFRRRGRGRRDLRN